MALHGSATVNLSPILTKSSNRIRSINLIIHQDDSGSMSFYSNFFVDGNVIEQIQNSLLLNKIGTLIDTHPNLYAYFDTDGRDPSSSFSISGSLTISQSFMRGESTAALTKSRWTSNYINRTSSHRVTLLGSSEDVHGNLWSIFTSPNSISSGIAGRYGSIIFNPTRTNSKTFIITNSDEQSHPNRINENIVVSTNPQTTRTINGPSGEMIFRGYRVIALSSYNSNDGYAGVLFYGSNTPQPYGYITLSSTNYTEVRSSIAPNWSRNQNQDTLTLASETRGALFKLDSGLQTNKIGFAKCIANFISNTI